MGDGAERHDRAAYDVGREEVRLERRRKRFDRHEPGVRDREPHQAQHSGQDQPAPRATIEEEHAGQQWQMEPNGDAG